ncbi:tRNA (guanosine(18)-2'-O)-methyltransferase TARBP1 isoform X2 [Tachypleus tridentatus]|uniref:tRNA (guanosine(18)-2'-O)-methyltransferase TARBP1 isoform X2 n=1 Tax=Tachypleus tridentatus TaxID=6853 RepID=UPI003FD17A18
MNVEVDCGLPRGFDICMEGQQQKMDIIDSALKLITIQLNMESDKKYEMFIESAKYLKNCMDILQPESWMAAIKRKSGSTSGNNCNTESINIVTVSKIGLSVNQTLVNGLDLKVDDMESQVNNEPGFVVEQREKVAKLIDIFCINYISRLDSANSSLESSSKLDNGIDDQQWVAVCELLECLLTTLARFGVFETFRDNLTKVAKKTLQKIKQKLKMWTYPQSNLGSSNTNNTEVEFINFTGLVRIVDVLLEAARPYMDVLEGMEWLIELSYLYQQIVKECDSAVTSIIMLSFMKFLRYCKRREYDMINEMWKLVTTFFKYGSSMYVIEQQTTTYLILCSVCDFVFSPEAADTLGLLLVSDIKFWKIIQHGLSHEESITRKKALFLFKRTLEWCEKSSINIAVHHNKEKKLPPVFHWTTSTCEKMRQSFEDMMVLLEVLEEKQVHVIKPVLYKLDCLVGASVFTDFLRENGDLPLLHTSWVLLTLKRMFLHENKFIVKWAIYYTLDMDIKDFPLFEQHMEHFVYQHLLYILNDNSLYGRSENDIFGKNLSINSLCDIFFMNCYHCLSHSQRITFFSGIITWLSKQSWSGIALFNVMQAISNVPRMNVLDGAGLDNLRELLLSALRTHEHLIRGAIQCYFLKTALKLIDSNSVTYQQLSKFLAILRINECLKRGSAQWNEVVIWIRKTYFNTEDEKYPFSQPGHQENLFVSDLLHQENQCLSQLGHEQSKSLSQLGCQDAVRFVREFVYHHLLNQNTESLSSTYKVECEEFSRVILLFADAGLIRNEKGSYVTWHQILKPVVEILSEANSRVYLNQTLYYKAVLLLVELILHAEALIEEDLDEVTMQIVEEITPVMSATAEYLVKQMCKSPSSVNDVEDLGICALALKTLSKRVELSPVILPHLTGLLDHCRSTFLEDKEMCESLRLMCAWRSLHLVWKIIKDIASYEELMTNFRNKISSIMCMCINSGAMEFCVVRNLPSRYSQELASNLRYICVSDMWECVRFHLEAHTSVNHSVFYLAVDFLETGYGTAIPSVIQCLKYLVKQFVHSEKAMIIQCMKSSWKACLELRKSDLFLPSVKAFVNMTYQPDVLQCPMLSSRLEEFSDEIFSLGENSTGIFSILVKHCCQLWMNHTSMANVNILSKALTFGPVHRKDQKIINENINYIFSEGEALSVNQLVESKLKEDKVVRTNAVCFLTLIKESHQDLANRIVDSLLKLNEELNASKSCYFNNSLHHLTKTRIWQSILILYPSLDKVTCHKLLKSAYRLLEEENQQPSVRYLLEFLAVRVLLDYPECQDDLEENLNEAGRRRVGSVVSFLSILILLSSSLKPELLETHLVQWIPRVTPWCMVQNINTRIYAQVALFKLWELSKRYNLKAVYRLCEPLQFCFEFSTENRNASKNARKLLEDFYFSVFDPVHHFTLETIFWEIPRLSNVADEEWIRPEDFSDTFGSFSPKFEGIPNIPIHNDDQRLHNAQPSIWVLRAGGNQAVLSEDLNNFQKKIMPWNLMSGDIEEFRSLKKRYVQNGLVVCASLIDRLPNLGGLCRTCEIFGVTEYVMGSLKYTEDKNFQSLSVSANEWIPITEVKPFYLREYLQAMKKQGYTLVGVEQTADSKPLKDYKFPKKTLLLLGNEKEGIPVELIQVLDVCVQIPQYGVTRSLNVHVSGALFIWEYASQHMSDFC